MTKHFATLPDGTTVTRNSKTHTYSHAIALKDERGWGVYGYRANLASAQAEVNRIHGWKAAGQAIGVEEVTIVAVSTDAPVETPAPVALTAIQKAWITRRAKAAAGV